MKAQSINPFLAAMKPNPLNRFRFARAGAISASILLPTALPVSAANLYWEGVATTQGTWEIWQTQANWDTLANGTGGAPGTAPTTGDIAIFNTTVNNGNIGARINANRAIDGLIFNNTGTTGIASETSVVRRLNIGSSGITMASNAGSVSLGTGSRPMNVTLDASQTWLNNNAASTLSYVAGTTLALGANTLTVDGAGATTISSTNITGTAAASAVAIVKNGAGVLTLNSPGASFTGDVQINAGTLRYGQANALPSAADVIFNTTSGTATLDLNGQSGTIASLTIDGAAGTNAAITTGAGTLTLDGNVNYNNAFGTPNGATISGKLDLGAADRTFLIRDSEGTTNELLVSADISGSGVGFTKTSNGVMTLSGLNTFTGDVVVRDGTLSVNILDNGGSNSSLGAGSGAVQLGLGVTTGILQYTGDGDSTNRQIRIGHTNTTQAGGGAIENNGSGALTFSNADFNAAVAGVTVTRNITLRGDNTGLNTISGIIRDNDTGTGGIVNLTKEGVGKWVLAGANTYTGNTTINAGTLAISGAGSIANSAVIRINASTTLDITGSSASTVPLGATQTITGTGTILATGKTVQANGTIGAGNSPGTLTQDGGTLQLGVGGDMNWQVYDADGAAGTGYDTYSLINGATLDLSLLSAGNQYNINLWSLSGIGPDVNGDAIDFNNTLSYSWTLFSTGSTISGFSADKFLINVGSFNGTSGFSNALGGGSFSVGLGDSNTDLVLNFAPVPEPRAALLGGLGLLCLLRRRRA